MMIITTKANGYKAEGLQKTIEIFNAMAERIIGDCEVEHFYYGDKLDMITIILPNRNYGDFYLAEDQVSFSGHTCTFEEKAKFESLTFDNRREA